MAILPIKLVSAIFLPKISFVIIMGKRDIKKLLVLPNSRNKNSFDYHGKLPAFFDALQPKTKAPQPSTQAFPTKGNSSKNAKKKKHNANKREVLQTHAAQI